MFYTCFLCACLFAFFVCLFVFLFLPLFLRCICLFLFGICAFLCWLLTAGVFFSARSESRTISLPPGFWQTYIRLGYFKPFFAISSYFPQVRWYNGSSFESDVFDSGHLVRLFSCKVHAWIWSPSGLCTGDSPCLRIFIWACELRFDWPSSKCKSQHEGVMHFGALRQSFPLCIQVCIICSSVQVFRSSKEV